MTINVWTLMFLIVAGIPAYTTIAGISLVLVDRLRPDWNDDNRLILAILWPILLLFIVPMLVSQAGMRRLVDRACPQLPPAKKVDRRAGRL